MRVRYQAGLAERARIAHELHDTLLQGFTGITIQLRAIERLLAQRPPEGAEALKNVLASADTTLRQARHTIWDLRAVELEGHDLAGALETAARATVAGTGVELVFAVRGEARRLRWPWRRRRSASAARRCSMRSSTPPPSLIHVAVEYDAARLDRAHPGRRRRHAAKRDGAAQRGRAPRHRRHAGPGAARGWDSGDCQHARRRDGRHSRAAGSPVRRR